MRVALYPYKPGSSSAKELSNALEINRIKHEKSKFKGWGKAGSLIINWGSSECPEHSNVLNPTRLVRIAGNKRDCFKMFADAGNSGPRTPDWTHDHAVASAWRRENFIVVCRGSLTGHSGQGITIVDNGLDIPRVPLYTKYVKKASEFRVHFVRINSEEQDAFYIQKKVRRTDFEGEPNFKIRSHENGFIYQHDGVNAPDDVLEQAGRAFRTSGLDFGAVDVIYNTRQERAYVLEINTAPGLQGLSVAKYAEAFKKYLLKGPIEPRLKGKKQRAIREPEDGFDDFAIGDDDED